MSGSETMFVVIGFLGFSFLVLNLLLGEVFEFGGEAPEIDVDVDIGADAEAGVSWLSTKVLFASMVGFGAFGFIATEAGLPLGLDWIVALFGFFAVGGGAFFLVLKPLAQQQSNSLLNRNSFMGRSGKITLPVPVNGTGLVQFQDHNGALVEQPAITADGQAMPAQTAVIIIEVVKDGVVVSPNPLDL